MTITDIAKELNLSISTVSKALNGSTDISEKTKQIVSEYAQSHGYRTRKSSAIVGRLAVLWGRPPQESGPLAVIAEAFSRAAREARYIVVSAVAEEDFDLNEYLACNRFDGALLLDINFRSPVYAQLKRTKYPLVLVDNYLGGNPLISGIGSDNIHAVEEAVDYLVSLGHERIAFLGGERESLVGAERLAGYILGLAKNSIEYRYDLTYFGDYSSRAGKDAAEYYLRYGKEFTAIICASDVMAKGFIARMQEVGKTIPQDFSVIGYDDMGAPELELTTIRQNFERTGELGFKTLSCSMGGLPSQRAMVDYELVPRGSTRRVARGE